MPSFIEDCLVQPPRKFQSIEEDYLERAADGVGNQTLVSLAQAALEAMSKDISISPRASQGKRKREYEDHRGQEGDGRCEPKQVTCPGAPLQVISSNLANTAWGRSKKWKHN